MNKKSANLAALIGTVGVFILLSLQALNSLAEKMSLFPLQYYDYVMHPQAAAIGSITPAFVGSFILFYIANRSLQKKIVDASDHFAYKTSSLVLCLLATNLVVAAIMVFVFLMRK